MKNAWYVLGAVVLASLGAVVTVLVVDRLGLSGDNRGAISGAVVGAVVLIGSVLLSNKRRQESGGSQ